MSLPVLELIARNDKVAIKGESFLLGLNDICYKLSIHVIIIFEYKMSIETYSMLFYRIILDNTMNLYLLPK